MSACRYFKSFMFVNRGNLNFCFHISLYVRNLVTRRFSENINALLISFIHIYVCVSIFLNNCKNMNALIDCHPSF